MKGKNEVGKMKGNTNNTIFMCLFFILGLSVAVGIIGAYAFTSESGYMDYVYSSSTNVTATPFINTSINGTQSLIIGDISRIIKGETIIKTIEITAENTDTSNRTITVYLNSVVLGNMTATKEINSTTTFENVNFIKNSNNVLTYVPVANVGSDLKVLNATGIYPSDNEDIKFDGLMNLIVCVLSLIILIGIIIQYLNKV